MEIESKIVKDMIVTKQDFILIDFLPIPKNTICMISAKGGMGKTNLSLIISSEYVREHSGNVALWLTEDEEGNVKHRINTLVENKIMLPFDDTRIRYIKKIMVGSLSTVKRVLIL